MAAGFLEHVESTPAEIRAAGPHTPGRVLTTPRGSRMDADGRAALPSR